MTKPSNANLEELQRRLEALENELGILRTMYQYMHSFVYGREQEYLDCFTADAAFGRWWRGETQEGLTKGREALTRRAARLAKPPDKWHKHLLLNPIISVDGDKATAESFWVYLGESEGAPTLRSFGRYLDKFVRCADGKWRILERIDQPEARAGYRTR